MSVLGRVGATGGEDLGERTRAASSLLTLRSYSFPLQILTPQELTSQEVKHYLLL